MRTVFRISRHKISSLLAVGLVLLFQGEARSQNVVPINPACEFPTNEQHADWEHVVVIDANTGARLKGPSRFSRDTRVQLRFVNKNPYRYDYRYQVDRKLVEAEIIANALGMFGLLRTPDAEEVDTDPTPQAKDAGAIVPSGRTVSQCDSSDLNKINEYIVKAYRESASAANDRSEAQRQIQRYTADLKKFDDFVDELGTDTTTPRACTERWNAATALADNLADFEQRETLKEIVKRLGSYPKRLDDLEARLRNEVDTSKCSRELDAYTQDIQMRKDALELKRKPIDDALETFTEKTKPVETFRNLIEVIARNPSAFVETHYLAAVDEPTNNIVTIYRKDYSSDGAESSISGPEIAVGRSRFTISGGLGLSFIDLQTYERQPGLTSETPPGIDTVVGIAKSSSSQFSATVQLNGTLAESISKQIDSVAWTIGISLSDDDGASNVGFYTGPTIGLIGDNFFVTVAYQIREVDQLGGGFEVGDTIPSELQGEIPVTRKSESGLILTFTYKLR